MELGIVIEQAMIFILGFLAASLFACGFAPLFWKRALRLSTLRLELRQPVNLREILAQRDAQAARFAVDLCREKQKTDFVTRERVRDLVKQGRLTRHLVTLHERYSALETQSLEQQAEIASLVRELNESWAEKGAIETALYDRNGLYERQVFEISNLKFAIAEISRQLDDLALALARSEKEKTNFYFQWQDAEARHPQLVQQIRSEDEPLDPDSINLDDEKVVPLDGSRGEKLSREDSYPRKTRASG